MLALEQLVLPQDIRLTPFSELVEFVRQNCGGTDGDFALSRSASRSHSKMIGPDLALLLEEFKSPSTVAEAVFRYSRKTKAAPEETLEAVFPVLRDLVQSELLLPADVAAQGARQTLRPGEFVNDWKIRRVVQSLEDSELCEAQNHEGVTAAVKILKLPLLPNSAASLSNEASVLRSFPCAFLPALIEENTWEQRPYLAIEWCPSVDAISAAEEVRQMPASRQHLHTLCLRILESYAGLHDRGIVHGDVHGRNVLVCRDDSVRLIDFGLARHSESPEQPARGGVSFFHEPELARAIAANAPFGPPDPLGEQYAIAVLLYRLVSGHFYLNFSLERTELLRQICEDPPLAFSDLGAPSWPEAERVLAKALAKHRDDRWPSVREFCLAWSRLDVAEPFAKSTSSKPLLAFVESMIAELKHGGALDQPQAFQTPPGSLNSGMTGAALGIHQIGCARGEPALLALADRWALRAQKLSSNPGAFYDESLDLTPQSVGLTSPFHTEAGVWAVRALLDAARGDVPGQIRAMDGFVSHSSAECDKLDVTLGLAGTLVASSLLYDSVRSSPFPLAVFEKGQEQIHNLAGQVCHALWSTLANLPPIAGCSDQPNLGVAHGWAGFLYATLLWQQAFDEDLPRSFEDRLNQLAGFGQIKGRGLSWPWDLSHPEVTMPGWCNGSAGHLHLWIEAYRMSGDARHLDLAHKTAWNVWETPTNTPNLCCGLAGQGYALLGFWKISGEARWLDRARQLGERAIALHAAAGNPLQSTEARLAHNGSLYKGKLGIAVLAADLGRPEFAAMPFFERQ